MGLFDRGPKIRVHLIIRGRIGAGWYEVDEDVKLPPGTTLAGLIDAAEGRGIPLRQALADSPHLADTLMLNGERCPVDANAARVLGDGDQIYLLAPLAGG